MKRDGMTRSDLREAIFSLLFMNQFNTLDEMNEQVTLFIENMKGGLSDIASGGQVSFQNETYIREKLGNILTHLPELDEKISSVSRGWKTTRMPKVDLTILRLAAYEILFDDDVPTGVAINEAVEIAKHYGGNESASFINGILGQIAKEE